MMYLNTFVDISSLNHTHLSVDATLSIAVTRRQMAQRLARPRLVS